MEQLRNSVAVTPLLSQVQYFVITPSTPPTFFTFARRVVASRSSSFDSTPAPSRADDSARYFVSLRRRSQKQRSCASSSRRWQPPMLSSTWPSPGSPLFLFRITLLASFPALALAVQALPRAPQPAFRLQENKSLQVCPRQKQAHSRHIFPPPPLWVLCR